MYKSSMNYWFQYTFSEAQIFFFNGVKINLILVSWNKLFFFLIAKIYIIKGKYGSLQNHKTSSKDMSLNSSSFQRGNTYISVCTKYVVRKIFQVSCVIIYWPVYDLELFSSTICSKSLSVCLAIDPQYIIPFLHV